MIIPWNRGVYKPLTNEDMMGQHVLSIFFGRRHVLYPSSYTSYDYRPTAKIFLTQGAWHQSPTSVAGGFAEERCADFEARKCLVNHGRIRRPRRPFG
jgi:hypothetical protein